MRRIALGVLILSVVATAVLFGVVLLSPGREARVGRLFVTALTVTVTGLLALGCSRAWARPELRPLAVVGTLLCLSAGAMILVGVWRWRAEGTPDLRSAFTVAVLGAMAAHASLLGAASLAGAARLVRVVTVLLGGVLAAGAIYWLWSDRRVDPDLARWVGVAGTAFAAGTVIVSVLQRRTETPAPADGTASRHCPVCGAVAGESSCGSCGARYRVELLA